MSSYGERDRRVKFMPGFGESPLFDILAFNVTDQLIRIGSHVVAQPLRGLSIPPRLKLDIGAIAPIRSFSVKCVTGGRPLSRSRNSNPRRSKLAVDLDHLMVSDEIVRRESVGEKQPLEPCSHSFRVDVNVVETLCCREPCSRLIPSRRKPSPRFREAYWASHTPPKQPVAAAELFLFG